MAMCQFFVNVAQFVNQYGLAVSLDVGPLTACILILGHSFGMENLYFVPALDLH